MGTVSDQAEAPTVRAISDVETLKAMADPTRLGILSALMRAQGTELPVRSVKELAAELGEPQTKLYRHVKQLEAVGLIKAVTSRVVSGIVEHRYQACQSDLMLGGLTDTQKASKETEDAVAAAFDLYRRQLFAAHRAQLQDGRIPEDQPHQRAFLGVSVARVPKAQATALRGRLEQLVEEFTQADRQAGESDDLVTVNVLAGYFSSDELSG
jgi:DNA-binding transcriptional ArsR family regulator